MKYCVIDFETANEDFASICQIGLVSIDKDSEVMWETLVNPEEDYFSNTYIHGIDNEMVKNSPIFPEIFETLCGFLEGNTVLSYGGFDLSSLKQVACKYDLKFPKCHWINAQTMVRRQWEDVKQKGYALSSMAEKLNFPNVRHHNALNDALLANKIIQCVLEESGENLEYWYNYCQKRPKSSVTLKGDALAEGVLSGETILFTGAMAMTRSDATKLAREVGADVISSVNKNVTMLVVGNDDIKQRTGKELSKKHEQVLSMRQNGISIKIVKEDDFLALINS